MDFNKIDFNKMFDLPKFESPQIDPKIYMDLRDPDEVTTNILTFLQQQSETAQKQFRTSRNLILATIVIMVLQIGYAVYTNYESSSNKNNLTSIIDAQSEQSEAISRMTVKLLDLQNQVRSLEQQNAQLTLKANK